MKSLLNHKALVIGLALVLQACATVGGRQQSVAFDTRPRGLSLASDAQPDAEDPRTPAAFEVKRSSQLKFNVHSGDFQATLAKECDFRFGTVLLGNLGLALPMLSLPALAGGVFLAGVGTDVLTGSAYECPRLISEEVRIPEAVQLELREVCKPTLVLPPILQDEDVKLTYALMQEAEQFVRRYDRECRVFVSASDRATALSRSLAHGMNFQDLFKPSAEKKLVQILRDTQAVRGVDMKMRQHNNATVEVEFRFWDLYDKNQISSFKKKFPKQKFEKLRADWLTKTLGQSLRLIPNSFAFLSTRPQLRIQSEYVTSQELIKRESLVGLLSVTSVQHPDQYNPWDIAFDFGPSFYFDSIHNRVVIDEADPKNRKLVAANPVVATKVDFTGYALTIPLDGVLSVHTPAGAFRGFLGLGLGLYVPTGASKESRSVLTYVPVHLGFDWVAYFSRNWFFQLGLHAVNGTRDKTIQKRELVGFDSWASTTFGVGYYFPSSSTYLETLLAKNK